jgi:hypothetical protein
MRGWLMIAVAASVLGGCEAPTDPAAAAPIDPLEEAIARGRFPDAVTRVLRVLARMPARTPGDDAIRQLGLSSDDLLPGGFSDGKITCCDWKLAEGYRLSLVFAESGPIDGPIDGPDPPDHLSWAAVSGRTEGGPDGVTYEKVYPYWVGGKLRYK